jgi:SAM-dependent methyltransferase
MTQFKSQSNPEIAWQRIHMLRQAFLNARGGLPDYWADDELLLAYDETLAQRIRWKWRGVWQALPHTTHLPRTLVDLGCGTGAASREILSLAEGLFDKVVLIDRSSRAVRFASQKIHEEFAGIKIETRISNEPYLVLVSHILSELSDDDLNALLPLINRATAIIWVESGRHPESRRLSLIRDTLRSSHKILAPCPHQSACGMLREGQEDNWCHFRAPVPREVHHSARWREISKQLGIDLRSLPVAYLFARSDWSEPSLETEDLVQILAGSRTFKGFVRYNGCHESGVFTRDYLKRHSKDVFERLSEPELTSRLSLRKDLRHGPL